MFKGECAYLAEMFGRWVNRGGGYVMSPVRAETFRILYAAGFTGDTGIRHGGYGGEKTLRDAAGQEYPFSMARELAAAVARGECAPV